MASYGENHCGPSHISPPTNHKDVSEFLYIKVGYASFSFRSNLFANFANMLRRGQHYS